MKLPRGNCVATFAFERLEGRHMLAGIVTVWIAGPPSPEPEISIVGDSAANHIVIHRVSSQQGVDVLEVRGIDTTIKTVSEVEDTTFVKTGNSTTILATNITISLRGGKDSLTIYDATIEGTLNINMGAGNDVLRMRNVIVSDSSPWDVPEPVPLAVKLGSGRDRTFLDSVSSQRDISIDAGAGRDKVNLQVVSAGTVGSGNALSVEMGPGHRDLLTVEASSADDAVFSDTLAAKGTLLLSDNSFGTESDEGFQLPI